MRRRSKALSYWSDKEFAKFIEEMGAKRVRSNGSAWDFLPLQEARARFREARPWWPAFNTTMTDWESEFFGDDDRVGRTRPICPPPVRPQLIVLFAFVQVGQIGHFNKQDKTISSLWRRRDVRIAFYGNVERPIQSVQCVQNSRNHWDTGLCLWTGYGHRCPTCPVFLRVRYRKGVPSPN